jgi:lysophospholipase L1-like esterase
VVRATARSFNIGLVDAAAAFIGSDLSETIGGDGVHLTAAGQARLADTALQALLESLDPTGLPQNLSGWG